MMTGIAVQHCSQLQQQTPCQEGIAKGQNRANSVLETIRMNRSWNAINSVNNRTLAAVAWAAHT